MCFFVFVFLCFVFYFLKNCIILFYFFSLLLLLFLFCCFLLFFFFFFLFFSSVHVAVECASMYLLERVHPSIQAAVDRILTGANKTPDAVVRDFDGCEYHIHVEWKASRINEKEEEIGTHPASQREAHFAAVTIALRHSTPFKELNAHRNFDDVFPTLFSTATRKFVMNDANSRSDGAFVAEVRIPAGVAATVRNEALQSAAQLRIWSYIPVFARQCELFLSQPETPLKPVVLHYHTEEAMVLFSSKGNFIVAIALRSASKDEAVFTRHFLQAMMDAKKLQREISAAPAFVFDHGKPPASLPGNLSVSSLTDANVFWCSFQLFRRHMEPKEHLIEAVTQLVNFRSTLAYHIHAGRTYMHALMRKRVESSMQVLNRAKTKTTGKAKVTLH
ncbi:Arp2/3 complex 34 kD subunit p34-Arc [Trypanosoma cruzi]|uniref:Arp2/3 complex 34 kDa subunit n=1 Tax=Trypanosoma cruzi TaxID=5693 RepID=A0A7J6YBC1_TRYCR|nr:Arp2/3 complex 34 kD subunit p34-Arc [Trypanosoma cruzi]